MKKMIPVYELLLAILGVFIFQLRETQALRAELTRIGKQQLRATLAGHIRRGPVSRYL
jgi:hypothetical protein